MENPRRRRFLHYFNVALKGDRAALLRRTELSKGRLTQLLDRDEPFGELAAQRMAERLGLPADYFEHDRDSIGHRSADSVVAPEPTAEPPSHWRQVADEVARQLSARHAKPDPEDFLSLVDLLAKAIPSEASKDETAKTVQRHLRLVTSSRAA